MERRRLVVGGGAAVVAAALTAVAGRGLPAAASTPDVAAPSTTDGHAQLVLNQVDANLGLVSAAGFQSQFQQSCAASQTSFAQRDPDQPPMNDLDGWVRQRMVDLCGTDSYGAAVTAVPQTRALLAFSYLAYTQQQDAPLSQVDPGAVVPAMLQTLEPDFLPVLLGKIGDRSSNSPAFSDALQASSAELDRIIAESLPGSPDGGPVVDQINNGGDAANFLGGVLVFVLLLYWVTGRSK